MKQLFACITSAIVLTACGGGADSPAKAPTSVVSAPPVAPAPPTSPACVPKQVRIAALGDSTNYAIDGSVDLTIKYAADGSIDPSTIFWWDARAQAPHSPPIELQALMDAQFGPGNVIVDNLAVPGYTAEMVVNAMTGADPTLTPINLAGYDVIFENLEVNDKNGGFPLAVYKTNILRMNPTIVETGIPSALGDPREDAYNDTVRSLGIPVVDVDKYVKSLPNWQQYYPDPASAHVTDALYKMIADNVLAPAVAKQVAPLRCVTL